MQPFVSCVIFADTVASHLEGESHTRCLQSASSQQVATKSVSFTVKPVIVQEHRLNTFMLKAKRWMVNIIDCNK